MLAVRMSQNMGNVKKNDSGGMSPAAPIRRTGPVFRIGSRPAEGRGPSHDGQRRDELRRRDVRQGSGPAVIEPCARWRGNDRPSVRPSGAADPEAGGMPGSADHIATVLRYGHGIGPSAMTDSWARAGEGPRAGGGRLRRRRMSPGNGSVDPGTPNRAPRDWRSCRRPARGRRRAGPRRASALAAITRLVTRRGMPHAPLPRTRRQMPQPGPDRGSATSGAVLSRGAARGGAERKLQGHHRVAGPPGARLSSSVSTISPRANRHRTQCGGVNLHAIVYRRTRTRKNNSNAIFLHECDIFLLTLRLRDIN